MLQLFCFRILRQQNYLMILYFLKDLGTTKWIYVLDTEENGHDGSC